jgi:plasmid stabilization system protein ParE
VIRLVVTRDAENDLADLLAYLQREANSVVAEEFGRDVRATLLRLTEFPDSGAPRPEFGAYVRMSIIYPYLLFYDHPPDHPELTLLRILHGKSNLSAEILMRR